MILFCINFSSHRLLNHICSLFNFIMLHQYNFLKHQVWSWSNHNWSPITFHHAFTIQLMCNLVHTPNHPLRSGIWHDMLYISYHDGLVHQIEDYLKKHPNFLGCFPHDSLDSLDDGFLIQELNSCHPNLRKLNFRHQKNKNQILLIPILEEVIVGLLWF